MALSARPYLVDNRDIAHHAEALQYLLDDHDTRHPLAVATGYVNLGGLRVLATAVGDKRVTRLLLGAAPAPGLDAAPPLSRFSDQLAALRGERDFSRFPPSRGAVTLAEVDAYLARDDVDVRRYTRTFLHGKAYLLGTAEDGRAALVSSANLTGPGMYSNSELGLVDYQPNVAAEAVAWFDQLWSDSVPYKDELRNLLFPAPPVVTPEDVYLRALLELYGDELFDTSAPPPAADSHVVLASFQRDGYERARAILERHHGVVYADGVGTGKTEVGLALIEEYALRQGRHALVVAPAQLRRMWEHRISETRLPAQVVSFQELTSDEQLADADHLRMRKLHVAKDSYRLIIVDEAHTLRNAGTTWYRAMTRLLGGEQKDVVLLTATPINNGLWDLYNLVMLFARHDRALTPIGIDSIRALFLAAGANERDAEALNPDHLFPLADAVSVRRDRSFIVENYPGATFPDGTPLRFPRPMLRTQRYDVDAVHPRLVENAAAAISQLTMARYRPSAYERGVVDDTREAALAGLLQSAVLKRFESCWAACLATVRRMIRAHEAFLAAWDAGQLASLEALREATIESEGSDLASWLGELETDAGTRLTTDFEPVYRDHVAADLQLLQTLESTLAALRADDDPKLALLAELLRASTGKVIVFASYGETISYLDENLDVVLGDARERVVIVGTDTDPDERTARLAQLCPDTVIEPGYQPPDGEVDLLLSTDVVSEGQNLQQAGAVISYDMPWNPQRVVQRNGRVIRLRSPHETVALTTMLPAPGDLETLLQLEARIQAKIVAAGVFGMETSVVETEEDYEGQVYADLTSLAERLEQSDETLLDEADDSGGSFAGEHLRAFLLRAAVEGEISRLRELPFGIGAAFRQGLGVPSKGPAGVFFACRTSKAAGSRRYWRYVTDEGVESEELVLLRRIEPGPAVGVDMPEDLEAAWQRAAADVVAEHNSRADPALAEQRLPPSQRWALSVLRDPSVILPTGAEAADDLLAVPRGSAVKAALSEVQRRVANRRLSGNQAADEIVDVVDDFGLTPVPSQPILEPIAEDDLGVVCWMRVLPAT